jgi:hypothetical protein
MNGPVAYAGDPEHVRTAAAAITAAALRETKHHGVWHR